MSCDEFCGEGPGWGLIWVRITTESSPVGVEGRPESLKRRRSGPGCWSDGRYRRCFRSVAEFPEVVTDGVECPFAFGTSKASEPEVFGVLSGFHLPEHGFNDRFASGIVDSASLGAHPACHAFTLSRIVRDPTSGSIRYPFVVPDLACCNDGVDLQIGELDRKSTRLNSSH